MKKTLLIVVAGLFLLMIILLSLNASQKQPEKLVHSFDECVEAGYAVIESYPEQCRAPSGRIFIQDIGNELEYKDEIILEHPRPNQKIESPLKIEGKAKGTWFFEANFSAELYDAKGNKLGDAVLTTDKEWMTNDFVPFKGEMTFENFTTRKGKLILRKANPSGLSKNDKSLIIPVRF